MSLLMAVVVAVLIFLVEMDMTHPVERSATTTT
jgi:hypothetical protein